MSGPTDDWTLGRVRDWLRGRVDDGAACPCCGQLAKVYRRKLTSTAARTMIAMLPGEWLHVPTLLRTELPDIAHQGGYATLGQHWRLIEESPEEREDGGRAGWWRLTSTGVAFVRDQITVPKYARLYDSRCLNLTGDEIGVRDALGRRFRYDELMAGL